ncbi:hypothetical protein GJV85_10440 [Sulfurimonas aquatica]|uniref:Uncharacterized protein n=1 Tax=Sulfurimonas aquatica TaxID=2672570 RepID=A0A975B1I4_9BACT|nr:hypothetical protein [Sulfurimonas aquatica]QSZ42511.1 hypothetical protein GJV85_10440 [Sulfurimonas aquatica]
MKLRLLLSIFFVIVTTLSALHETEHTLQGEETCLVCHVNDNLTSADILSIPTEALNFHYESILDNGQVANLHLQDRSNQNRAPPKQS